MSEELWRELRKLSERLGLNEREVAEHLGECKARHAEIQRRFEEATRGRTELRADNAGQAATLRAEITAAHTKIDGLKGRLLGLAITLALATMAIVVQIVLQATKLIQ